MKYTVCVFREMSSDVIEDRYLAYVEAPTAHEAKEIAVKECAASDMETDLEYYAVGPVFEGWLDDLN